MRCRHCETLLEHTFVDLGFAPPSNAYLTKNDLSKPEIYYPLRVLLCDQCWLVQTEDYAHAEDLFRNDYAYFSSTSSTWLDHSRRYSEMIVKRLGLTDQSFVVEVASNDGYLLRNFVEARIPCLGVEPTASTADSAEEIGIPVIRRFFTESLACEIAAEFGEADLVIGNNVYAHVPDINGFTRAIASLLKRDGVVTLEFPHLLNLVKNCQFDTIYHEHYSYLSLGAVVTIFNSNGLDVWDVERIPTHGGSLRVYGGLAGRRARLESVGTTLNLEKREGLQTLQGLRGMQTRVNRAKTDLLAFLVEAYQRGTPVVGYGAAAKGNTLLNSIGVKPDLLPAVFDLSIAKQGKFLPGSHIPVLSPAIMPNYNPAAVLALPWNIISEVTKSVSEALAKRVPIVSAIPSLTIS